jgi:hypothetical protein
MIPVQLPPEPQDFNFRVRQPGFAALRNVGHNPNNPPPNERFWKTPHQTAAGGTRNTLDYWTIARDDLCNGYNRRCVYSCFVIEPVRDGSGRVVGGDHSIDHFDHKSLHPAKEAFEWTNLRWCWNVINNKKGDSSIAIDAVSMPGTIVELEEDVKGDWIVVPAKSINFFSTAQVQDTIDKLGLNTVRPVVIRRNGYVTDFVDNIDGYSDAEMFVRQPFIFSELRRLGRI